MADSDLTGKQLGEFKLLRPLGSGGMADVYLAEQTTLQRYVAVKIMKPALMAHSGAGYGGTLQTGSDDGRRTQSSQHCAGLYNW